MASTFPYFDYRWTPHRGVSGPGQCWRASVLIGPAIEWNLNIVWIRQLLRLLSPCDGRLKCHRKLWSLRNHDPIPCNECYDDYNVSKPLWKIHIPERSLCYQRLPGWFSHLKQLHLGFFWMNFSQTITRIIKNRLGRQGNRKTNLNYGKYHEMIIQN